MSNLNVSEKTTTLCDVIKHFRFVNQLNCKEVAEIIDIPYVMMTCVEKDERCITNEILEKLANVYNVAVEDFYQLRNNANANNWNEKEILKSALEITIYYQELEDIETKEITFGNVLKAFRIINKMSIALIARKLNVSQSLITYIEKGQRNITADNLEFFAKAYQVESSDFYSLYEQANKEKWTYQKLLYEVLKLDSCCTDEQLRFQKTLHKNHKINPKVIKAFRVFFDLSPEQIATQIECSVDYYYKVEKGKGGLSMSSIKNIAHILQIEVHEIFELNNAVTENEWCFERIMSEIGLIWRKKNLS